MEQAHPRLVNLLRNARRVMVFTGAGVSTHSGIPDFRGPEGVWTKRQPVMYADFLRSEAARREYWEYKLESLPRFRSAAPNATHVACAKLERAGVLEALVTQNVDGLHERAGISRARLVELHGTNGRVECQTCGREAPLEQSFAYFTEHRRSPRCPCRGLLKPATISFGQQLNAEDLERAARAAMRCDLAIALGSTLSVYPAAEFPLLAARRGVPYVIVNRGPTDHDGLDLLTLRLKGDVAELFPAAVDGALLGAQ